MAIAGFVAIAFGYPLAAIAAQLTSFGPQLSRAKLAADLSDGIELLLTTFGISIASVGLALLIGLPFALGLNQLRGRLRRAVETLVTIPFLLPALLIAIAFGALRNAAPWLQPLFEAPLAIIVLAHALMNFGLVARVTAAGLGAIDGEQREAAALDGSSWFGSLWRIELPQLRGSLAAVGLLIALYSATSYGLVRLLGAGSVNTLETEIGIAALQQLDLSRAAVLAVLQTVLTVLLFVLATVVSRNTASALTLESGDAGLGPRGWARALLLAWVALASLAVAAVLAAVFWRSVASGGTPSSAGFGGLSLQGYLGLFDRGARDLLNISVAEATLNSLRNLLVALAIALPLAWLSSRAAGRGDTGPSAANAGGAGRGARGGGRGRGGRGARLIELATLLPLGTSAVVLGLGYLVGFSAPPLALRESWLVVPIAQSVLLLPLLHQLLAPARRGLGRGPLEAAELDGAAGWQRAWFIELPMLRRPVLVALGFGALISIGEFGAASFLAFGAEATLPLVLFRLASRPGAENLSVAMAAATLLILLTALVLAAIARANSQSRE